MNVQSVYEKLKEEKDKGKNKSGGVVVEKLDPLERRVDILEICHDSLESQLRSLEKKVRLLEFGLKSQLEEIRRE